MKKTISLVLAVIMTATVFIGLSIAVSRPGDVNGDGNIDNKDVVTLFRYLSGAAGTVAEENCDFNGDGVTDNKDVVALFRALSSGSIPDDAEDAGIAPRQGSTVSLLNDLMTEWSNNYTRGQLDEISDYTEKCEPVPVHFSWEGEADYTNLFISINPDMSDSAVYLCSENSLDVEDLLPGTQYYWQTAQTKGDQTEVSDVHSFKTLQTIRTVYIPGVSNVRDLGGKITTEGKRVKYGMVYRGADFEKITRQGIKKAVNVLGIKTELDLREVVENGKSKLGRKINYISVTAPLYYQVKEEEYKDDLLTELRAFADPDNYPIYFHCSLGRDRTGTLAIILMTLLGVDEDDLYMDYEVSFFSDLGGYITAGSEGDVAPSSMLPLVDQLYHIICPANKNRIKLVRSYLKNLGMTDAELDAIRTNLLEDVK